MQPIPSNDQRAKLPDITLSGRSLLKYREAKTQFDFHITGIKLSRDDCNR